MKDRSLRIIMLLFVLGLLSTRTDLRHTQAAPYSDSATHAAIDDFITERMQALGIPGAALAIVQGDQIEYLQGYGVADPTGRKVTPQTPFMLASVSKSFTALAIMQLAEAGKLDLDAPVRDYLTWFRAADEQASAEITVRQLLIQTSGFSETDGNTINLDTSMAADALSASMKRLNTFKLIKPPGEAFEYSNINYGLLGAIVEALSGQSFETYIQQNIFSPLDMKHTYASLPEARSNGASSGYYPFLGMPMVFDNFMPYSRAVTPWAGIFSSAEDMAHYLIAHLNQGKYGDKTVVSADGMTELHRPGIQIDKWSGYGMGWWVGVDFDIASQNKNPELISYTAPVVVFHEGSWANFRTIAIMVPQSKIGIVLLMNSDDPAVESAFAQVGWDVVSIHAGNEPSNYPPREDFIRQHALPIFIGLIILLLASCVWFIRKLRSLRQQPPADRSGWRKLLGYVVVPIAIDVLLAWFLLAVELPQARITVWGLLRNAPDLGLLVILVLGLTLGWGAIRTLLMLQAIFRKA